jgi:hypothetical protein
VLHTPTEGALRLAPVRRSRLLRGARLATLRSRDQLIVTPGTVLAGLSVIAFGVLLWLGRAHSFVEDEFDFLGRHLTVDDVLRPHNEHLSAIPVLIYQALMAVFGTGSYVPYLTLLLLVHVVACWALYRCVGGWRGASVATILLFLGSGYENLFWAFQIAWLISIAAGLTAMSVRDGRLAAALAGLGIASSGLGLIFLFPLAVVHGRRAVWLALPLGLWLLWHSLLGAPMGQPGSPGQVVAWTIVGVGWAVASVFGVGLPIGLGGAAAAALGVLRSRDLLAFAAILGLLAEYAIIAVARSAWPLSFAAAPRYVYVAAPFLLIIVARVAVDRRLFVPLMAGALIANVAVLGAGAAAFG